MQKLIVPEAEAGRRLDKYLLKILDAAPKSFLYKAFRKRIFISVRTATVWYSPPTALPWASRCPQVR